MENSVELMGHDRVLLRKMGSDEGPLRRRRIKMRAAILDHSVGVGRAVDQGNDRVIRHIRLDRHPVERGQNGAVGAEVGDGIERTAAQLGRDHVGPVMSLDLGEVCGKISGPSHHDGDRLAKTAISDRAAAMRRGDEDDPAHERQRAEYENVVQRLPDFRGPLELVARDGDRGIPECELRILHHHLGEKAAHAVADQYHPIEGGVGMAGIEASLAL